MSKLDELIAELCPDGVDYLKLEDVATIDRGVRVVRNQLAKEDGYPVYQNSLTPLGYYEKSNCPENTPFVISAGAAGEIGYSAVPFWAADDCLFILGGETIENRYIYHALLWKQPHIYSRVRKASIPRLSRTVIEGLKIPVPPLEVQREIVCLLDNFTEQMEELQECLSKELEARKKQIEHEKNKLLSFDDTVSYVRLDSYYPSIRNGFVGTVTKFFSDKEHGVRYLEGRNIHSGTISNDEEIFVTKEFHAQHLRTELQLEDIVMVQSGHVGECAVVGPDIAGANCHALIIMSNAGECNSRFMMHYFYSEEGKKQLARITTGETVKHILASAMQKFLVPSISLEEQNRLVNILDRLDESFIELQKMLTNEIDARRKQYEYYRDKWLTFKEKVS